MEQTSTLHNILDRYKWGKFDVKVIEQFLEKNSSSINEVRDGYQPLHIVLRSNDCRKEVVKLLLDYGAEVNPSLSCSISQLRTALLYVFDLGVIKLLLEGGADVNRIHDNYCSLLSFALHRRDCNVEEVQMLLEFAGAPRSWCQDHNSLLQCYVHRNTSLRASVVELLIRKSADLGNQHPFGRSTLCYALHNVNCETVTVKLLLAADIHSVCDDHLSPLHCYMDARGKIMADIVKLLLEKTTDLNLVSNGGILLRSLLRDCIYEVAALNLLLEKKEVDVNSKNEDGNSPLICALSNYHHYFLPEAIQLLIKKGARLDEADSSGWIPLHYAVTNIWKQSLVEVLVNNGSPLNVRNNRGLTPIQFAFQNYNYSVIKLLLVAGAKHFRLDECVWMGKAMSSPRNIGESESKYENKIKIFKLCLRYAILKNRNSNFTNFLQQVNGMKFVEECIAEVQWMEIVYISEDITLLEFASCYPYAKLPNLDTREYDFNKLLVILASEAFPLYFEIISTKVKRAYMENKLQELMKYVVIGSYDSTYVGSKMVILNSHCVAHIASFLPNDDFLRFIIALKFLNIIDNPSE